MESGERMRAPVVIGADGVRSRIAKALGLGEANYAGYIAYRCPVADRSGPVLSVVLPPAVPELLPRAHDVQAMSESHFPQWIWDLTNEQASCECLTASKGRHISCKLSQGLVSVFAGLQGRGGVRGRRADAHELSAHAVGQRRPCGALPPLSHRSLLVYDLQQQLGAC